jgi:hypothetical protein
MCGGDSQAPPIAAPVILSDTFQIAGVQHDAPRDFQDLLSWFRQADDAAAAPEQDVDSQMLFEKAHLLADIWLRSVQGIGRPGHREALIDDLA